jgi:hypothetical protein
MAINTGRTKREQEFAENLAKAIEEARRKTGAQTCQSTSTLANLCESIRLSSTQAMTTVVVTRKTKPTASVPPCRRS